MKEHEIDKELDGMELGELMLHIASLIYDYGEDAKLKVILENDKFKINILEMK